MKVSFQLRKKKQLCIESLVDETVANYIHWFAEQAAPLSLKLHFINIPAPLYNVNKSSNQNQKVANVVRLFNVALEKKTDEYQQKLIDVYSSTKNLNGFANEEHHVDGRHLGTTIIPNIQMQLN